MRQTKIVAGVLGIGLSVVLAGGAAAQLDPPAGPIVKTGKTLVEVEPRIAINATNTPGDAESIFRITQPGSYYLTGNVIGQMSKSGIKVEAERVTIDLNGFEVRGVADTLHGVVTTGNTFTLRNGFLIGWTDQGAFIQGEGNVVEGVHATGNGIGGFHLGAQSIVRNCIASDNGGVGFYVDRGSSVWGCAARGNAGFGFLVEYASSITECVADANVGTGIAAGSEVSLDRCVASNNAAGYFVNVGSVITGCAAYYNATDGIIAGGGCVIRDNTCSNNGTAAVGSGVASSGADSVIEGNACTGNDFGIRVESAGNLIVRNSCSGNTTNFDIAAGNRYGPIVNITAGGAAAATGNAAPSTLTTTDPWANFAY